MIEDADVSSVYRFAKGADGRVLGDLAVGDVVDNSHVKSIQRVTYNEAYTHDILPSGSTGFYWG